MSRWSSCCIAAFLRVLSCSVVVESAYPLFRLSLKNCALLSQKMHKTISDLASALSVSGSQVRRYIRSEIVPPAEVRLVIGDRGRSHWELRRPVGEVLPLVRQRLKERRYHRPIRIRTPKPRRACADGSTVDLSLENWDMVETEVPVDRVRRALWVLKQLALLEHDVLPGQDVRRPKWFKYAAFDPRDPWAHRRSNKATTKQDLADEGHNEPIERASDQYSEFLEKGCGALGESARAGACNQLDTLVRRLPHFERRLASRRLAKIHEVYGASLSAATLAKSLGISRSTLYRLKKRRWIQAVIGRARRFSIDQAPVKAKQVGWDVFASGGHFQSQRRRSRKSEARKRLRN